MSMMKKIQFGFAALAVSILSGCGGGSGSSPAPAKIDTSQVHAAKLNLSSYENKINAVKALGPVSFQNNFDPTLQRQLNNGNSIAFADFFGDGNYSMVGHTLEYDWDASKLSNMGHIKFFKMEYGKWIDRTSVILADASGCLHPRKAVVSDFNLDSKPDVFIACTGMDLLPFPGEPSLFLMSTASGKYEKIFMKPSEKSWTHGATVADLNNDGYPDLVTSSMTGVDVSINNKNGTFLLKSGSVSALAAINTSYSVELIKFDGGTSYDLFVAGHEQAGLINDLQARVIKNDGSGNFTASILFPKIQGFGFALDIIYQDGYAYLLRTVDTAQGFYSAAAVQKVKYPEMIDSAKVYSHSNNYPTHTSWVNWIGFYQNNVVSIESDYGMMIQQ